MNSRQSVTLRILFLLNILMIHAGSHPTFAEVHVADSNTVALWLFDEAVGAAKRSHLEDATVNGNDLTLCAGARLSPGRFNNALEIMGDADRTAVRRYIDTSPLNLGDFDWTWELWINMKAAAQKGAVVFDIRQGPFDRGPRTSLQVGDTPGELVFVCQGAGIEKQVLRTTADVFAGRAEGWHHVAVAYTARERRLTHWMDGKKRDSAILPNALVSLAGNGENSLSVGSDINGWHPLPALLDEIRVSRAVIYTDDFTPPGSFAPHDRIYTLNAGPHLFIDDALIAKTEHLTRTTHQPQRLAEPILREREIRPGWTQKCGGLSVMYDPETKFRMWMCVKNEGFEEPDFYASTYWKSDDGLKWDAPALGTLNFDGHRKHNIIMTGRTHNLRFHSDGVLDEGPNAPDPARRFKIGYFPLDWRTDRSRGMNVAFSRDGVEWKPYEGNPVLRHHDVETGKPGAAVTVADINDMFYDEERKLYVQTYKTYALPHEYPMAAAKRDERWRDVNDKVPGYRRLVGLCTSKDFVNWTNLQRVIVPDDSDPSELQFYAMSIIKRGDLYIGHVRCLDDQAESDGTGWMQLATSRDLYHWRRHRDVFFNRNSETGSWDGAICWHGRPVIVGDEMWFYYNGLGAGHKSGKREVGLAKLRKDGYVSRDAGEVEGTLLTVPSLLKASSITVNANVDGDLRIRVVDDKGRPLPGFDYTDGRAVEGDSVAHVVRWKSDLSSLQDKVVRLQFSMRNARLYGLEFK